MVGVIVQKHDSAVTFNRFQPSLQSMKALQTTTDFFRACAGIPCQSPRRQGIQYIMKPGHWQGYPTDATSLMREGKRVTALLMLQMRRLPVDGVSAIFVGETECLYSALQALRDPARSSTTSPRNHE